MTQTFFRRSPSAKLALMAMAGTVLLAGCQKQGGDVDPADRSSDDPALSGALADKIAVDPAKTGDQGAALAANGDDGSVPQVQRSPDAIAAALGEARAQVGGTLQPAPAPQAGSAAALAGQAATAAQVAGNAKLGKVDCSKAVKYSATWAAKLPPELPVFPRGAVQEAAGPTMTAARCAWSISSRPSASATCSATTTRGRRGRAMACRRAPMAPTTCSAAARAAGPTWSMSASRTTA
ncbi:hypothetical protein [Novosphingobium sp. 9]|uniref:hypothetical protein n=1 Tax=Novosphingobium sp. 9 TaxID=2025349 RepID=UPI0021B627F6|nr:hypothetical protein [Novosphingobium sp. 9]